MTITDAQIAEWKLSAEDHEPWDFSAAQQRAKGENAMLINVEYFQHLRHDFNHLVSALEAARKPVTEGEVGHVVDALLEDADYIDSYAGFVGSQERIVRTMTEAAAMLTRLAGQGAGWQTMDSAPRDGRRIVCWAIGWEPCILRWKTNHRIVNSREQDPISVDDMADSYFGDPVEWDDYSLARPGRGPTHWRPLPTPPSPPPIVGDVASEVTEDAAYRSRDGDDVDLTKLERELQEREKK